MSDWADEEAAKMFPSNGRRRDQVAAALRAAHKRGKIEGLREAKDICCIRGSQSFILNGIKATSVSGETVFIERRLLQDAIDQCNARITALEAE